MLTPFVTTISYVKAIQLLSQNLHHPQRCYEDGNIAATLLLYFYEVISIIFQQWRAKMLRGL